MHYEAVGSGVGVKRLNNGFFDFACTDAPLSKEQLAAAQKNGKVIHIPLVLGAVVAAYNLPGEVGQLTFSGEVLADIYLGKITRWNDEAIKKLNPNAKLPSDNITVIHRSDRSGTTYIWTDYLARVSPEWQEKVGGADTWVKWPKGIGVGYPGSEAVASRIEQLSGAIGYVELGHAKRHNLMFGKVQNKEKVAVAPSVASITAAAASADIPDDLCVKLADAPGKDTYPICGTVWAVVSVKQSPAKAEALVGFLRWATHDGQKYVEDLDYARLPPGLVERLEKKLDLVGK
jgi:phosphate transport system substrate-binding protein